LKKAGKQKLTRFCCITFFIWPRGDRFGKIHKPFVCRVPPCKYGVSFFFTNKRRLRNRLKVADNRCDDEQNRHTLVIPGSSIRGVVRRWAERYDKALVEELFGNDIISGSEPKAGKLIFSFARAEDLTNKTHNKRYGIKINQLGTVEANALYSYEFFKRRKADKNHF